MNTAATPFSVADLSTADIFITRAECPACDGANAAEIFRKDLLDPNLLVFLTAKVGNAELLEKFKGVPYRLMKCAQCGLIYQQNILNDRLLSTMYNEWILHTEETPRSIDFFAYYANELFTIRSLFKKPVHAIKVLDYGLGAGKWAKVAKAIGFDIYGTDISQGLLADARRDGIKTIEIDRIGEQKFDFINTEQVFEHLARPKELLLELVKSLEPNGILKISVPDGRDIEKRLPLMDWSAPRRSKRFLIPVTPLVHINTFTHDVITRMGALQGLREVTTSLRRDYRLIDATSAKGIARSIFRPLYRRMRPRAYAFLRNRAAT